MTTTRELVLAIDPAPRSTALGLFQGEALVADHRERHPELESGAFQRLTDQVPLRSRAVRTFLDRTRVGRGELAAVVGRGGLLRPVESGTYLVDADLLRDAEQGLRGEHPANLGAPLARVVADDHGCPAFVVDPLSLDELDEVARLAARAEAPRPLASHALLLRAVARRHATAVERELAELRLVVAHLGDETSVCVLREGRFADVAQLELDEASETGLRAEAGDVHAMLALDAMAYQAARVIGGLACSLAGEVDAVLLAGSAAGATGLVNGICRRVEWVAPVFVYPGDAELAALAAGAWRVLRGEEQAKPYR